MNEFKGTPGKWVQSHRLIPNDLDGMYATQVHTEDGETIATIHWYSKPKEKGYVEGRPVMITGTYRESNAQLISKAPEFLSETLESITDLKILKDQIDFEFKNGNFRWKGMSELIDQWIARKKQLIQDATTI